MTGVLIGAVAAAFALVMAWLHGRSSGRNAEAADTLKRVQKGIAAGHKADSSGKTPEEIAQEVDKRRGRK